MSDNRHISFFLIFSIFFSFNCLAVVKGSETVVSVEPLASFPMADNDNEMLGFGWFKNGFTLEDSSTTCTFNSVYPVSGEINLNGGKLYLLQDFRLSNTASLQGGGDIFAENYVFELCSGITSLSSTFTFHDVVLCLHGDVSITDHITFDGDCLIDGHGYHIDFEEGGAIFVSSGATLHIEDMEFYGISSGNIVCEDDSSKIVMHNVSWVLDGDFIFDTGSIKFFDIVEFKGDHTFFYESSQTSTIDSNTNWIITGHLKLQIGRKEAVDFVEPLYFTDETSILRMDNCSFVVTASGIGLTKGEFELDREVWVDVLSSTTTNGLIIGTGQEEDDFSMHLDSGASIHINSGCWVYNNYNSFGKLHALSEASRCIRYGDSKFYVMTDWTIPSMVFKVASGNPESILCDGVTFRYQDTYLSNSVAEFQITGGELAPGFQLSGDDYIYMTRGSIPLPIYVSGLGNKLHGTGDINSQIILQDSDSDLCFYLNGMISQDIVLNGGKISLMGDLHLGADTILSGSGNVDLSYNRIYFGSKSGGWDYDIFWESDNGSIAMQSDIDLCGTWTFSGDCIIDGFDNTLCLDGGGVISIDAGSKLILRNLIIHHVSDHNIICIGDDSIVEFDNVSWIQSDDFFFDAGSIIWRNDVDFRGAYSFAYGSSQTSTILSKSELKLDSGFTFSYDPGIISKTLLEFEDRTSKLTLNGATLHATVTGLQLTKGYMNVTEDSTLASETLLVYDEFGEVLIDEGITFGNDSADEDFKCDVHSGETLMLSQGTLNYRNVTIDSLELQQIYSILHIGVNATLNLYESMDLRPGQLVLGDGATFAYANGRTLEGSIRPLGRYFRASL